MKIALLTLTCDRPLGFQLAEHYMQRQLHPKWDEFEWVVADGGRVPVDCNQGQRHVIVSPYESDPKRNFLANLAAGLRAVSPDADAVAFIEDDDWYHPLWLSALHEMFSADPELLVAGEADARYYNIQSQRYWLARNKNHASLCSTAVRTGEPVDWLLSFIERHRSTFVDMHLWKAFTGRSRLLHPARFVVGMKGIPGRAGIGVGHRLKDGRPHDAGGRVLRSWIGSDADLYRDMMD